MLTGGCFCKQLRYEAGGEPFHETVCHCAICRGTTGAPMVAWFTVPRGTFHVTGTPMRLPSSEWAARSFCPNCGTQITFEHAKYPGEIDVTTASLDDPEALPPRDHSWVSRRLHWVRLADGLPEFPKSRSDQPD